MAVIMAGGFGTRLRPLTEHIPKPLVKLAGRPCIDYVIKAAVKAGFNTLLLTTSYKFEEVIKHVKDGRDFGAKAIYSVELEPKGTAGGVKMLEPFLKETFAVLSGDVLADVDLGVLLAYHRKKGAMATIGLTRVENPTEFGIVGLDDEGRITRFKEKPAPDEIFSHLINAGIYILEPEALTLIPENTFFDFSKNLFPLMLERSVPLYGMEVSGLWRDIGRPEELLEASKIMLTRQGDMLHKSATIKNCNLSNVYVGAGAKIIDSTLANVSIYSGSTVEGSTISNTIILENCIVEEGCTISDTIMDSGCRIGKGATISRCVFAKGTAIKKGEKIEGVNWA